MNLLNSDLLDRIRLNRKRIGDSIYRAPDVYLQSDDWPGDFVGRTILSLSSLYKSLIGYPEEQQDILNQLQDIFQSIENYLNSDFYWGEPFNGKFVNEQQLSGNSWYLRGLVEYYSISKDATVFEYIERISEVLLSKLSLYYENYPVMIHGNGAVSGHLQNEPINGWRLSTDNGCAFIMVDGFSAVYELLLNERLKNSLDLIIEKFMTIDYVSYKFQTHATLSCARGILRMYKVTHDEKYLKYVEEIFANYTKFGMTIDYANYNWFGREDSWTEPCAIVDSMILAKWLYLLTRNNSYLQLFNRIYINSLRTFQRDNGGAGCSTCASSSHREIKMHLYEAFFCCSMRLGEGLYEIASFYETKDSEINIYYPGSYHLKNKKYDLKIKYDPYGKHCLSIEGENLTNAEFEIKLYLPFDVVNNNYHLNYKEHFLIIYDDLNEALSFNFEIHPYEENGLKFYGDLILSTKLVGYNEQPVFNVDNEEYSPLSDSRYFSEDSLKTIIQKL